MRHPIDRRRFLGAAGAGGALLALGLPGLPPVRPEDARIESGPPALDDEIGPLVRLIEETPRERLLEEIGARIRAGLPYRRIVGALMVAAVRNVQPRPSVGFKFHAVLVVHSCHFASLSSPDAERWLPIFWALDYFKDSQAREASASGWRQGAADESRVPASHRAAAAFVEAMDSWDESAADAAAAGVARHLGKDEAFELFARYAARDWRSIGHKAIFVSNGWRVLDAVGWRNAEPILRSLAHALLAREGQDPRTGDLPADRPWRINRELARELPAARAGGPSDPGAAADLLAALREASPEEASRKVVALAAGGASERSTWDALFVAAGEILARRPDILSLHAVTTLNAIRHCAETTASDDTRRVLLLQAASFIPLFRGRLAGGPRLDALEPIRPERSGPEAVAEILADLDRDRTVAARKIVGWLRDGGSARDLADGARLIAFRKARDSHDYKFAAAVLEDYLDVSPPWRDLYLAASAFRLLGPGSPDSGLLPRLRAALGA